MRQEERSVWLPECQLCSLAMILPSPAGGIQGARQSHLFPHRRFNRPAEPHFLVPVDSIIFLNIEHLKKVKIKNIINCSIMHFELPPTPSPDIIPSFDVTAMSLAFYFLGLITSNQLILLLEKVQIGDSGVVQREAAGIPQLLTGIIKLVILMNGIMSLGTIEQSLTRGRLKHVLVIN